MKYFKTIFGLSAIAFLLVVACSKNEESQIKNLKLKVSNFNKIGEIHNSFLTNVKNNFTEIESITDEQEKIKSIYEFNKNFVSSLDISSEEKNLLIYDLEKTKDLVKESVLIKKSFGNTISSRSSEYQENDNNIFGAIDKLKASGKINDSSYQILNSLSNDLKENYEGILSDNQLKTNVQALVDEYNEIGHTENTKGEMVGVI